MFRKPRDMSLEISETICHAADAVLLTFLLVWRERQRERPVHSGISGALTISLHG